MMLGGNGTGVAKATRVLLVEDNVGDARLILEMIAESGESITLSQAETLIEALSELDASSYDAVILDLGLPDSQGMETFTRLRDAANEIAIIVLTGNVDKRAATEALERGAQDYLVKGHIDSESLTRSIGYALSRMEADTALRQSESQLKQANIRLENMVFGVAEALGRVVEARDPYTSGHEERVARICKALALEMQLSEDEVDGIEMAGLVHDVGKLIVPAEILTKPGRLTELEFNLVKAHSQRGYEILQGIDFPWPIADIVLQHHERMDGSGYPNGLRGTEILLAARVIAVADVVEAMASHRPYRAALGADVAVAEIVDHPSLFDPDVTRALVALEQADTLPL
jgi:HD-GYP domain-containing protein (c-di-GMP phosphodiesterase class II)